MTNHRFNVPRATRLDIPSPQMQAFLFPNFGRIYTPEGMRPGKEQIDRFLGGLKSLFDDVPHGDDIVVDNSTRTVRRDSKSTMIAGRNFLSGMWDPREGKITDRLGFRTRLVIANDTIGIIRDEAGQQTAVLQRDVTVNEINKARNYDATGYQAGSEDLCFQFPATVNELTLAIHAVDMANFSRQLQSLGQDLPGLESGN